MIIGYPAVRYRRIVPRKPLKTKLSYCRIRCRTERIQSMIVLNVTYKCKPGLRDEFLEMIMAEGIDEACRAEDGNIKYDYYLPADGNDELLLVEKWRDADALAVHGRQPHFARIGELKADYVEETAIEKFES